VSSRAPRDPGPWGDKGSFMSANRTVACRRSPEGACGRESGDVAHAEGPWGSDLRANRERRRSGPRNQPPRRRARSRLIILLFSRIPWRMLRVDTGELESKEKFSTRFRPACLARYKAISARERLASNVTSVPDTWATPKLAVMWNGCRSLPSGVPSTVQSQPFGNERCRSLVRSRKNDDEFLPAKSGHDIDLPQFGFASLAHAMERVIACGMSVCVVHGLEVIQVDHHHTGCPGTEPSERRSNSFVAGLQDTVTAIWASQSADRLPLILFNWQSITAPPRLISERRDAEPEKPSVLRRRGGRDIPSGTIRFCLPGTCAHAPPRRARASSEPRKS